MQTIHKIFKFNKKKINQPLLWFPEDMTIINIWQQPSWYDKNTSFVKVPSVSVSAIPYTIETPQKYRT